MRRFEQTAVRMNPLDEDITSSCQVFGKELTLRCSQLSDDLGALLQLPNLTVVNHECAHLENACECQKPWSRGRFISFQSFHRNRLHVFCLRTAPEVYFKRVQPALRYIFWGLPRAQYILMRREVIRREVVICDFPIKFTIVFCH